MNSFPMFFGGIKENVGKKLIRQAKTIVVMSAVVFSLNVRINEIARTIDIINLALKIRRVCFYNDRN